MSELTIVDGRKHVDPLSELGRHYQNLVKESELVIKVLDKRIFDSEGIDMAEEGTTYEYYSGEFTIYATIGKHKFRTTVKNSQVNFHNLLQLRHQEVNMMKERIRLLGIKNE